MLFGSEDNINLGGMRYKKNKQYFT